MGRLDGVLTGEATGQQFAYEAEPIALVQAEGPDGALGLLVQVSCLGRRPALVVEKRVARHGLPLHVGHPDLAERDRARRHVEQDGALAVAGDGAAERVGEEPRLAAGERRDDRVVPGHVDEVEADVSGAGATLAVRADAPQVMGVAQRERHDARVPRPFDREVRGLAADHLPEAAAAVQQQDRAPVLEHLDLRVGLEVPARDAVDIVGHHADAVGIVPLEVREHEVLGGLPRELRARPRRDEDRRHEIGQPFRCDQHRSPASPRTRRHLAYKGSV